MWLLAMAMGVAEAGTTCGFGFGEATDLRYVSASEATAKEAARAKVEMREPNPVPPHGFVIVTLDRLTIGGADLRYQIVVVERGAEVMLRHEPTEGPVPNVPGGGSGWTNYLVVDLPEAPALTVRVIDKLRQKACLWDVAADGKVGKPRKE